MAMVEVTTSFEVTNLEQINQKQTIILELNKNFSWHTKFIIESKNPNWFLRFLPEVIKYKVLDYLNMPHESVTFLYVLEYCRKYIFNKNYKYFYLSSGFCSIKYRENIFKKNALINVIITPSLAKLGMYIITKFIIWD